MIVSVKCPKGCSAINYGAIKLQVQDDGTIDVPAYVALGLIETEGFSCKEKLPKTIEAALSASENLGELGYFSHAYNRPVRPLDFEEEHAGQASRLEDEDDAAYESRLVALGQDADKKRAEHFSKAKSDMVELLAKRGPPRISIS